jgi:hypothetical protein
MRNEIDYELESSSVSTIKQPLKFFEFLFLNEGVNKFRESFFDYWEKEHEKNPDNIELFGRICDQVMVPEGIDEYGNLFLNTIPFSDVLAQRLDDEALNSKSLLNEAAGEMLHKHNDTSVFFNEQKHIAQAILKSGKSIFKEYPFCKSILLELVEYISDRLPEHQEEHQKENVSVNNEPYSPIDTPKDIIEIFGYLGGMNEYGQKIMTDSEYTRLISLITVMVKEKGVPEIDSKFERLQITDQLLRFTFYVLHIKLYGQKPRQKFFTQFLKDAFSQFAGYDPKTLYSKFSQPPNDLSIQKWIPETIRLHSKK